MHPISLYTKAQLISHLLTSVISNSLSLIHPNNLTGIIPFRNWLTHSWTNSQLRTAHSWLLSRSTWSYVLPAPLILYYLMSYPWLWTHIPTLVTYGRTLSEHFLSISRPSLTIFRPLPTLCELLRSFVNSDRYCKFPQSFATCMRATSYVAR